MLSSQAFAMGSKTPRDAYYKRSLDRMAERGGVNAAKLESLWGSFHLEETANPPLVLRESETCLDSLRDSAKSRNELLECLSAHGAAGLTPELGHALFIERGLRLQAQPSKESIQTSALLGFVEDIVREKLRADGQDAVWMDVEKGYINGREKTDFEFKDGDVVIGLGNSSLSSLISQVTNVPSRYSHAFVVRIRDGKMATIESLVETGVKSFPLQHLIDDPYNQLTVLRWKDDATRAAVTRKASDWAQSVADRKAEYDMEMDFSEDEKIYCSELVAKAYAYASGIPVNKIVTHRSGIDDDKVFKFTKLIGVAKREYVAPGDLFNTDQFEIVAEYRKPDDLMRAWELYLMGDLFVERLQEGHQVLPDPVLLTVPVVAWVAQLLPSIFHEDARLIPKSIGPYAMSVMATTELHIYNNAIGKLKKTIKGNRSLLNLSPWEIRAELDRALDTHTVAVLSFPKVSEKNRRRPGPRHGRR